MLINKEILRVSNVIEKRILKILNINLLQLNIILKEKIKKMRKRFNH